MNDTITRLCIAEEILLGWKQFDNYHAYCFSGIKDIDEELLNIRKKLLDEYNKSSNAVKTEVDRRRALIWSCPSMNEISETSRG